MVLIILNEKYPLVGIFVSSRRFCNYMLHMKFLN